MPKRRLAVSITLLVLLILASIWIYLNPSLQERVSWHLNQWLGRLRTWLHPPQAVSFSPVLGGNDDASTLPDELVAAAPSGEMESSGDVDAALGFEQLPKAYSIAGGNYFSQSGHMNYCGPSALAMLLSTSSWVPSHSQ